MTLEDKLKSNPEPPQSGRGEHVAWGLPVKGKKIPLVLTVLLRQAFWGWGVKERTCSLRAAPLGRMVLSSPHH